MNAKQAKGLRRMARALTEGQPAVAYQWFAVPSVRYVGGKAPVMRLHPECTRALYKRFKQAYKRLARKEGAALQIIQKLRGQA